MSEDIQFFSTCPKGLENLLLQELRDLGLEEVRETSAGVYFQGDIKSAYRVCLWSRLANKVLLPLSKAPVRDASDLYRVVAEIPWFQHFKQDSTLAVDFSGTNQAIRHSQFGAQKVKDAIVDQLMDHFGARPSVDLDKPDVRINARLAKGMVHISLDLSGESLHRRGYRAAQGGAPLKENLAAAILLRAGWPQIAAKQGGLLDPMCGSGTFLLEGLMIAADIAPGLIRAEQENFGFTRWKKHDDTLWQTLVADAKARKTTGLAKPLPEIRGYDCDRRVLDAALTNVERAGFDEFIRLTQKNIEDFKKPTHKEIPPGLMICNPPYGERLGEVEELRSDYQTLGRLAKTELPGWQFGVFTGNKLLGSELRLRARKKYKFFNGPIESELLLFEISEHSSSKFDKPEIAVARQWKDKPLSDGAQMVLNRLSKNHKKLRKWKESENIDSYRLYDADMPEYAAAIDVYHDKLHIQEYAAPKSIEENKAKKRFDEIVSAAACFFDCPNERIYIKTRSRQKGRDQYQKLREEQQQNHEGIFWVTEGKSKLKVNLVDYLDTGVFLDHRPLRMRIFKEVAGKSFLNLFCYTASASVQAAVGGATRSVSVDMSNTYLQWAEENFKENNIHLDRHELVRADCFQWLKECRQGFDMIMLDPPTFSNSKKMEGVLDVQRDHVPLIRRCMDILAPGGCLFFSNNLRNFKMDFEALNKFKIRDISASSLDMDFKQNPKIHNCWEIRF